MYEYAAEVIRVVDGDTVDLSIDLGLRVYTKSRIRLLGLNAPEKNTIEGMGALAYLTGLLPVGTTVVVKTHKDKADKYGRWLGELVTAAGFDVNKALIESGHAAPWDGKGQRPDVN